MPDHTSPLTSSPDPTSDADGDAPSLGEDHPSVPPASTWRRLAAIGVSQVMGIGAYTVLSPVVVGYTFLTLGALGFALLGGGIAENGSLVQDAVLAALAIGDGAWVDWAWRRDLSFEENALRLFGGVGLLLWLGELLLSRFRGRSGHSRPEVRVRLKRFAMGLAGLTAILSTILLVGVLMTQSREVGLDTVFVLRATFTAYAMGGVLLLFCAPSLAFWFFIDAARGPVADLVAGTAQSGGEATGRP